MPSDFIERAKHAAERLSQAREQLPILASTEATSDDGMVTVRLDRLSRSNITIDRGRTYSYEEYEVKAIIIDTYNLAVRSHDQQMRAAAGSAAEVFQALNQGRE